MVQKYMPGLQAFTVLLLNVFNSYEQKAYILIILVHNY